MILGVTMEAVKKRGLVQTAVELVMENTGIMETLLAQCLILTERPFPFIRMEMI
jgi:hypothetical protein